MATKISDNLTANGNTNAITWQGGQGSVYAEYNSGSGTIKLQVSPDGGTSWLDLDATDAALTGSGAFGFVAREGDRLRINLSSASSADIDVWLNA